MEIGLVKTIDIDQEMQQAYLDYAMSVIVSRALPDARDGLKPVHRRIMYAMYDMGLRPDTSYKKSARIVGEVLGKYHPHGDAAVYDAMARLAQDFSTRYPLVDGQGNFGSMDGDPPAAMRYTEARMDSLASDLLTDIQKDTVDFTPNFDDTLEEPIVLPASFPNLLVNGATGIAVGMSTSIPPHNLGEVVDALIYMLNNWSKLDDINVDDLMKFIKGPDFPTGGVIIIPSSKEDALKTSYGTGRGRITVQSRAHVEEMDRGRKRVIVTELPYMTNKTSLLERIAKLVRDGKLEGVSDLRDETDREGMRIVIELTKGTDPEELLRKLYRSTTMQGTFSIINLALVDGEPRLLGLKQALRVYLEHRHTVVRRRSEHDLNKSRERAHILEGLIIALKNLDEIIDTIRRSRTVESARNNLRRNFSLSESQAQAILNMPLRRLASLEQKKIDQEYKDVVKQIKFLERLLRSPKKIRDVISNELQKVKEVYGDPRRTRIVYLDEGETKTSLLTARDIAPDKNVWVSITTEGLISRTQEDKLPRLSGSAAPEWLVRVNTRDTLYLVAENGTAAGIGVHSIPEADKPTEGIEFTRISPLDQNDKLTAAFNLLPKDQRSVGWYVVTVTKEGLVKKSEITDLPGATAQSFILARVNEGDAIKWVHISDGKSDILLATKNGLAIRFSEEDVRPMGLVAAGVMGIKLKKGDEVIGAEIIDSDKKSKNRDVFLIRNDSQAKRVKIDQFPTQGRYGLGVIAWKLPNKTNLAGMTIGKYTQRIILHLHELTAKSVRLDSAPIRTRPSNGNSVIDLKEGDWITKLSVPYDFPRPEIEIERKKSKGKRKGKTKKRRQKNK